MNQLNVTLQTSIKALAERGWPHRRIARELGVDRSTVRRYARSKPATNPTAGSSEAKPASGDNPTAGSTPSAESAAAAAQPKPASNPTAGSSPGPPSLCEPFRDYITAAIDRGLSAQRIFQDLHAAHGFPGSYESVKRYVRRLGLALPLPCRRMESAPGEQMQVDFGLGAPVLVDGKRRRPWLFRAVLSHSRKGYTEVVWQQDTETFIRCVENAFRHFGGVTAVVIVDNLKAAVLEPDWFDPLLNPKMAEFAAHYGTVVLPTAPARPEHKGKVEAGVKYAQNNACAGRTFASLGEQNRFLADWEAKVADTRIHGTVRQQVRALFATERAHLRPLPASVFPSFTEGKRKVHRDGHVEFERAYYSVPPEYLGREVWVRGESKLIRILNHRREQIAAHVRAEPGRFATAEAHLHEHKRHGVERGARYWLDRCRLIGPATARWAEAVHQQRGLYAIRSLQGLVGLTKKHPAAVIETAAERATQCGTVRLRDLRGLLGTDSTVVQLDWLQSHALIRDMDAYRVNALCL